jgi:hypothetical protein
MPPMATTTTQKTVALRASFFAKQPGLTVRYDFEAERRGPMVDHKPQAPYIFPMSKRKILSPRARPWRVIGIRGSKAEEIGTVTAADEKSGDQSGDQ